MKLIRHLLFYLAMVLMALALFMFHLNEYRIKQSMPIVVRPLRSCCRAFASCLIIIRNL